MLRSLIIAIMALIGPIVVVFSEAFDLALHSKILYLLDNEAFEKATCLGLIEISLLSMTTLLLFCIDSYDLYLKLEKKGIVSLLFTFYSIALFNSMLTFSLGWLSFEYHSHAFNDGLIMSIINSVTQIIMIFYIAFYMLKLAKISQDYPDAKSYQWKTFHEF